MDPMEYIVPNRKRLPYGMMNFAVIRREDYYYVDKTAFALQLVEQGSHYFLSRPRRFGKSLFLIGKHGLLFCPDFPRNARGVSFRRTWHCRCDI